ncbi:uncharacterized protein LOC142591325 [Dermacentor variabilis]|uniref:uncharacterized protein LOC142591325 n=1 Tax=Dermacentor variabilis TaxID=34621 RepID=UPI003F5BC8B3
MQTRLLKLPDPSLDEAAKAALANEAAAKGAGASVSVMAGKLFKRTFPGMCVEASSAMLRSYSGQLSQVQDQAQREGILVTVKTSEFAAPILPVLKRDGSIRICEDLKVTVNPVATVKKYLLPRFEDLCYELVYCPGKDLGPADDQSRLPSPEVPDVVLEYVQKFMVEHVYPDVLSRSSVSQATSRDPVLSQVVRAVSRGEELKAVVFLGLLATSFAGQVGYGLGYGGLGYGGLGYGYGGLSYGTGVGHVLGGGLALGHAVHHAPAVATYSAPAVTAVHHAPAVSYAAAPVAVARPAVSVARYAAAPAVSYATAPALSYAAAPAVSYASYAAPAVTAVHHAPAVSYAAAPVAVARPAVSVARYAAAPAVSYASYAAPAVAAVHHAPAVSYAAPAVAVARPAVTVARQSYTVASAPAVSYASYAAPAVTAVHHAPAVSYAAAPVAVARPAVSYASYAAPAYAVARPAVAAVHAAPAVTAVHHAPAVSYAAAPAVTAVHAAPAAVGYGSTFGHVLGGGLALGHAVAAPAAVSTTVHHATPAFATAPVATYGVGYGHGLGYGLGYHGLGYGLSSGYALGGYNYGLGGYSYALHKKK